MKLFFSYLKSKWRIGAAGALFLVVFAVCFSLYHLPLEAVLYPCGICVLLGLLFGYLSFQSVKKKHSYLQDSLQNPTLMEVMETEELLLSDCEAVVEELQRLLAQKESDWQKLFQDRMDYFTVWAHQIKTPIAAMSLTLQNSEAPEARALRSELRRIEQYVEMVLVFIRLGAEETDYVLKECELDPLIRQSIRRFASDFIAKKLTMSFEPTERKVITDEKWLAFVLEQILSNSIKYTRQGGIRIYLSDEHVLCIEDSGIGIAPEDLPRIFQKGYTGYNGRIDKRASGLGLYLCKQICDRLHIGISAASEVDRGTKIFLDLSQYEFKKDSETGRVME